MGYRRYAQYGVLLAAGLVLYACSSTVAALTSSSPNYQIVETEFNAGTNVNSCSGGGQYCARTTMGSLMVGDSEAGSRRVEFGPITEDQPALEVIVEPGESDLGVLTTEHTATSSVVVKVRNYLSNGYVLQFTGSPPKYSTHALATPSTPTASAAGTEQFALNAVANTEPKTLGANPVQVPSGQFSFGEIMPGYATPNVYKYTSGDTIARSLSESGQTDYTISMIVNIANNTPAGHYSGEFSAVVIPTY